MGEDKKRKEEGFIDFVQPLQFILVMVTSHLSSYIYIYIYINTVALAN